MARYIDADALKSIKSIQMGNFNTIETIQKWIDEQPTADVVERKIGMWCVTPDGKMVCSNCFENPTNRIIVNGALVYDMTPIKKRMRFCPNCGADMRGEEGKR